MFRQLPRRLSVLVLAGTAVAQGGEPSSATGILPGAGTLLATLPPFPLSHALNRHVGIAWDDTRGTMWIGNEGEGPDGMISLYEVEPASRSLIRSQSTHVNSGGAYYPGSINGIAVLADGTLLLTDFNGDGPMDDAVGHWDPETRRINDLWFLDGVRNGNTNVPQVALDGIRSIATRNTTLSGSQEILVSAPYNFYFRLVLTPGNPGTWRLAGNVPVPYNGHGHGLSYDSRLSSFWLTNGTSTLVHEVKFNSVTNTMRTVQAFPVAPASTGSRARLAVNGSSGGDPSIPYEIWVTVASDGLPSTIAIFDSGHQGGAVVNDLALVAGAPTVSLTEDEQNGGAAYLGMASFSAVPGGWLPLDTERLVPTYPDPLFLFSLQTGGAPLFSGLSGNFDADRNARIAFRGLPELLGVPLSFYTTYLVLDPNQAEAHLGIRGVGPEIGWFSLTEAGRRQDYVVAVTRIRQSSQRGALTHGIRILGLLDGQPGVPWDSQVRDEPVSHSQSALIPASGVTPATVALQGGFNREEPSRGHVRINVRFSPPGLPTRTVTVYVRKD